MWRARELFYKSEEIPQLQQGALIVTFRTVEWSWDHHGHWSFQLFWQQFYMLLMFDVDRQRSDMEIKRPVFPAH